jgi:hypothetical protein
MMDRNLNIPYFYNENGELDEFTKLVDCFNVHLYFILKSRIPELVNPYEIFLRDISFYLSLSKDGSFYDFDFPDNSLNTDVFILEYHKGKGPETLAKMEKFLDQGEPVIVYTDTRYVPFFNDNQGEGTTPSDAGVVLGHVFLVIAHEPDSLYYVEAPWNLNLNHFKAYEGNRSIGVIPKQDLEKAFASFLTLVTVKINEAGLPADFGRIKSMMDSSVRNYFNPANETGEQAIFYGKQIFEQLNVVLTKKTLALDQQAASCPLNVFSLLDWRILNINRRRIVLKESLQKALNDQNSAQLTGLISAIDAAVKAWQNVLMFVRKKNIKKQFVLDESYLGCFAEVAACEERMMNMMMDMA